MMVNKIEEQIFENLYRLTDGTYLKWNRLLKGWVIAGTCSFDILEDKSMIVKFENYV